MNIKRIFATGVLAAVVGSTAFAGSAQAYTGKDLMFLRGIGNQGLYSNSYLISSGHYYCQREAYHNRNVPWYKVGHGQNGQRLARADVIRYKFKGNTSLGSNVSNVAERVYC